MFKRYLSDERGNFAIMFAIIVFVILICVGAAIDISKMVSQKQKLSDIADSTALAASLVARDGNLVRRNKSEEYYVSQRAMNTGYDLNEQSSITFDDGLKEVTVIVSGTTNMSFMGMFGYNNKDISASSTVGYAIDFVPPISLAFAFDTSGSMGDLTLDGQVKIDALEQATGDLFQEMFTASENPSLLQQALSTSFSTYNTDIVINDTMRTGYQHIVSTMSMAPLFVAGGGTNSTPSVQFAINELIAKDASEADDNWTGHMIFMTDGDNNDPSSDTDTLAACTNAKAQGFTIYTVAFAAPANGEALLSSCATDAAKFFTSADADALKDSFRLIGEQLGEATVRIKK